MINQRNTIIPADCILIHTDGSCIGNPGPGGWAASLRRMKGGAEVKKLIVKGGDPATTNNRMELVAAIEALKSLRVDEVSPIIIRSDSQYLVKGMTEWQPHWVARGWRKADGKAVGNQDLWKELIASARGRTLQWHWVRGHMGNKSNVEVEVITTAEAQA
ncbi:ribonuclease HI [Roseinatronobacter thiooxidans]|uniref:Ribonuclease H n=2 Tax=Roseinatronobacter thiooxidans TaxID=121821 RepID=A0A2W7PRZ9_9RHOB|nr:ribonuclease H [Roseinatronobacter thiooxidans]PZX38978.1 ribonuclease HI [Roseinatronobacter thiooxidans]